MESSQEVRGCDAVVSVNSSLQLCVAPRRLACVENRTTQKQIVGAAIVDSLAKPTALLVARRTAPEDFAGMWEFPGGKVEPGESDAEALHRELAEELGVTVRLGAEIAGPGPGGWPLTAKAVMRVFLAEIFTGEPQPLQDHDLLSWVPLDPAVVADASEGRACLEDLPWIPADRPIVEALRAHLAVATA
jgi:8-oxo-dGTP diphosphatase